MSDLATADWLSIDPDDVVWQGGPRVRRILPTAAASLVGVAVAAVAVLAGAVVADTTPPGGATVAAVGVAVGVLSLSVLAVAYLRTANTVYLLTPEYALCKRGVLGTTVTRVPLSSVQNTSLEQGVLGNAFDHGTVTLSTAGGEGAALSFTDLDDPAAVRDRLRTLLGDAARERPEPRASAPLPAEAASAMLAEVRTLRASADRVAEGSR